jgi:diacylglycerol kinase (ATP)
MWEIIVNPKSGKKALRKRLRYLSKTLETNRVNFEYHITKYAGHATEIAREMVENSMKKILVVGGDGTFSEVINGVFSAQIPDTSQIQIALIPSGTGNDWGRFWGLTRNYKHSISVFLRGRTQAIDVGQVEYVRNRKTQRYFFVNSVGFGIDQRVVHETQRLKFYFGSHSFLYFLGVLKAVFSVKANDLTVQTPDTSYSGKVYSMNIGNGCYSGGGMKQNPAAVPTDGFFDAMIVKRLTARDVLTAIGLLFNGKLAQHPIIQTMHSREIRIVSNGFLPFEADGIEVNAFAPYCITVLPLAIQMIRP